MKKRLSFVAMFLLLSLCLTLFTGSLTAQAAAASEDAEESERLSTEDVADLAAEVCPIDTALGENKHISFKDGKALYTFDSVFGSFSYEFDEVTGELLNRSEPDLEAVRAQEDFVEPLDSEEVSSLIFDICPIDVGLGEKPKLSYKSGVWTYNFDSVFGSFLYEIDAFTGEVLSSDEPDLEAVRAQEGFVEPLNSTTVIDRVFEVCPISSIMATKLKTTIQPELKWLVTFTSDYGDFLYLVDAMSGEILDKTEPDVEAIRASGKVKDVLTGEQALEVAEEACPLGPGEASKIKTSWRGQDKTWTVTFGSDYGDFVYVVDGTTGKILEKTEPDMEAMKAAGTVNKTLDFPGAMDIVFKVCPIERIMALDIHTSKLSDGSFLVTFGSDFGDFSYTVDKDGNIVEREEPDVEGMRAAGTVKERINPREARESAFEYCSITKDDAENVKSWGPEKDQWAVTFDYKGESFYFLFDAFTGEILDKTVPAGY